MSVHLTFMRRCLIIRPIAVYPRHFTVKFDSLPRSPPNIISQFKNTHQLRAFSSESFFKVTKPSSVCQSDISDGAIQNEAALKAQWREYFDHTQKVPRYHNLCTGEITNKKPIGFPSRFGDHYHTRETIGCSAENVCSNTSKENLGLKSKLALYGGGGLLLYLVVHNMSLGIVFASLYFLEIDLFRLAERYNIGFYQKEDPEKVRSRSFIGTFVTAIAFNKMLVPLQITVSLLFAPVLAPRLQPVATKISAKLWYLKASVGF